MKSRFIRFIETNSQSPKSQTQYGGQSLAARAGDFFGGKGSGKGSGMRVHSFFGGKGSGKGCIYRGDGGHKRERDGDGYWDGRGQGSSKR